MLSLMLENGRHASLPLIVFRTESQGEILVRGEGCNTLGVYHQLSNGFELKHDILMMIRGSSSSLARGDKVLTSTH